MAAINNKTQASGLTAADISYNRQGLGGGGEGDVWRPVLAGEEEAEDTCGCYRDEGDEKVTATIAATN